MLYLSMITVIDYLRKSLTYVNFEGFVKTTSIICSLDMKARKMRYTLIQIFAEC